MIVFFMFLSFFYAIFRYFLSYKVNVKLTFFLMIMLIGTNLMITFRSIPLPLFFFLILAILLTSKIDRNFDKRFIALNIPFIIIYLVLFFQFQSGYITNNELFFQNLAVFISLHSIIVLFERIKFQRFIDWNFFGLTISMLSLWNSVISILQMIFNKTLLLNNFNDTIFYTEGVELTLRAQGLVGASNGAGNFGVILFPILLYRYLNTKRKFDLLILFINIVAVGLTQTRIAYVAMLFQFFIFWFYMTKNNKTVKMYVKKYLLLVIGILIGVGVLAIFGDIIIEILFLNRGNTQSHRFWQWSLLFTDYIPNNFMIGLGLGQYTQINPTDIVIHSELLSYLTEVGFLGFLSVVFLNVYLYIYANNNKNNTNKKWLILSLFIGNLMVSNFNPNQFYSINIYLYYIIMLFMVVNRGEENERNSNN